MKSIDWYRSPVPPALLKGLQTRSDGLGFLQAGGYLATILATLTTVILCVRHHQWAMLVPALFLHGTVWSFMINAVHELGHGTVFRTRALNRGFEALYAFLGHIHMRFFTASHARHHQATLHPPDDLEVVLPVTLGTAQFLKQGFLRPLAPLDTGRRLWRMARGRMAGRWETALFPKGNRDRIRPIQRWAWVLIIGHSILAATFIACGIVVDSTWFVGLAAVTFAPYYGNGLFWLCNHTQHTGKETMVADFRRCCRTVTLNPAVQFLYWHMNYHTEHHMYPAVPCYRLGRLHRAIRADLPPCPRGLLAAWREISPRPRPEGMETPAIG